MITAKFKISRVSPMGDSDKPWAHEIEATPDYSDGRNKEWAEATPAGVLRLTCRNDVVTEQLPLGTPITIMIDPNTSE